jgi:N-acetylglucosaminyldiphosphoundecaprenol N-acetyl-beta-D-mannosaminyltransferase
MLAGMNSRSILNCRVDGVSYESVCDHVEELAMRRQSGYVIAANVHVIMTAYWNRRYQQVVNQAAIVTPDGMPLVLGLKLLGNREQTRVYGPDLMLAWCDRAAQSGLSIYLYGSSWDTLARLKSRLLAEFPMLKIAGVHSPTFGELSEAELREDCDRINGSGAAVVLVALGCPKQELWMARALPQLDAVAIGVGAAFRFFSGEVSQAPRWMMRSGLEWVYRFWQEPGRLWRRYVVNNPAFLVLFGWQLLCDRLFGG